MRNLVLLFTALILGTTSTMAAVTAENKVAERNAYRYNDSFIFVEEGITFAVYPDGEFDFYIDNRIGRHRRNVTFNSGFDYSPYAQYDDYGAVIQVENIPIYYDYYGRVSQIGDVNINYRNGRVRRVGGMVVFYNNRGFYDYHTGYINVYNRFYTWRPWHAFFVRPAIGFCLVNVNPYRRWYNPIRYTYYNPYRYNRRWSYATIGKEYRHNKVRRERASVYRNDKRVTVRDDRRVRSNRTATAKGRTNTAVRSNRAITKRDNGITRNNRTVRRNNDIRSNGSRKVAGRTAVDRTKRVESRTIKRGDRGNRTVTKRSTTVKNPRQGTVSKRTVTRTPQRKTVSRSTTVKRPQSKAPRAVSKAPSRSRSSVSTRSSSRRLVAKAPSKGRNTYSRSSSSRSRVSKAPSRNSKTYSRSSSSRSRVSKAPSRSSRNNSRSTSTRSGRRQ